MIPDAVWLNEFQGTQNEYLIEGLLSPFLTTLSGQPKVGKSTLATQMVKGLIHQTPVLDKQIQTEKTRVCWMGYDGGWASELKSRLTEEEHKSILAQNPVTSLNPDDWGVLGKRLEVEEVGLIVIDHLYGLGGHLNLNESHEARKVIRCLEVLITNHKIPVLLIAQAPKNNYSGGMAHSNLLKSSARLLLEMSGAGSRKTLKTSGNEIPPETIKFVQTPLEISDMEVSTKETKRNRDYKMFLDRAKLVYENATPAELVNASTAASVLLRLGESKTLLGAEKMAYRLVEKNLLVQTSDGLKPGPNFFNSI